MNLAFGSKLAGLQKPHFWRTLSVTGWFNAVLKRNVFAAAAVSERLSREIVQRTVYSFKEYNIHHDWHFNRPILHLWLLNRYKARLTKKATQHEVDDTEYSCINNAHQKLENYCRLFNLMMYGSELCETVTMLMNRECTISVSNPLSLYRASKHNSIEKLYPEIEAVIYSYYDLIDQCKDYPDWVFKIQYEVGNQIAFLATSISENSRDYLVKNSPIFLRFDQDKQKFFK